MKFFQKTRIFNEELPIKSIKLFKYAIVSHFLMAYAMFGLSSIFSIQNVEGNDLEPINLEINVYDNLTSPPMIALSVFILIVALIFFY